MTTEGGAKKTKGVDVRKPSDKKALEDILKKHPITIILIHADWCGHCQRYKDAVWNGLHDLPSKKNGLAAIHHDQLQSTPFANAEIRGYPSVIIVGKKQMAEFEDEEGPTNAIPMEQANDADVMKNLVLSAEPSTLTGTFKNMKKNVDEGAVEEDENTVEEAPESVELSEEAKASREAAVTSGKKSSATRKSNTPLMVPDPTKDTLDTQEPSAQTSMEFNKDEEEDPKKAVGGSLYNSLLAASKAVAPAAALVAAGTLLRKRKTRKGRGRGKRRGTRRRGGAKN
jgi:thiol-disulfide isomerase/thioredoxin